MIYFNRGQEVPHNMRQAVTAEKTPFLSAAGSNPECRSTISFIPLMEELSRQDSSFLYAWDFLVLTAKQRKRVVTLILSSQFRFFSAGSRAGSVEMLLVQQPFCLFLFLFE